MDRRTFVGALGIVLLAAPLAEAQQAGKVYRMGMIAMTFPPSPAFVRMWDAFSDGLRQLGYARERTSLSNDDTQKARRNATRGWRPSWSA